MKTSNILSLQQKALIELKKCSPDFILMRQPLNWERAGDIDILVRDIDKTNAILIEQGYAIVQDNHINKKYVKYDWDEKQWIHLDVVSTIVFGEIRTPQVFIDGLFVRADRTTGGIPILDTVDEAILIFFHAVIDKGELSRNYKYFIFDIEYSELLDQETRYLFLSKHFKKTMQYINEVQQGLMSRKDAVRRSRRLFVFKKKIAESIVIRVVMRVKRILSGPISIVFLGPDGSGKSTITGPLSQIKWPRVRCQYMGPARETEMCTVFKILMNSMSRLRNRFPKKNIIGMFSRVVWQIACYLDFHHRLWRHLYFWSGRGVVIFDRYPCDMYFRKPTRLNEFLFIKIFPRPRFVFLCIGDEDSIYSRKKEELFPVQIKDTIERYRKKLSLFGIPYRELDTTKFTPKEVLIKVVQHLIDNDWFRSN